MSASQRPDPVDRPVTEVAGGSEPVLDGPQSRPETALAFLLAPGIAALAGSTLMTIPTLAKPSMSLGLAVLSAIILAIPFAVVGYLTALVLAVPIFLALPERARNAFAVVVPLAGVIAAFPWLLLAQPWLLLTRPWNGQITDGVILLVPFGFGCVAGVAFVSIRRPRRRIDPIEEGGMVAAGPSRPIVRILTRAKGTAWSRSDPRNSPTTAG